VQWKIIYPRSQYKKYASTPPQKKYIQTKETTLFFKLCKENTVLVDNIVYHTQIVNENTYSIRDMSFHDARYNSLKLSRRIGTTYW
jgi:hypothetical protein